MIYFITDGEFIKVGTAGNVRARISGLTGGNARKLTLLASCGGGKRLEKRLHHVLPRRAVPSREWYRPSTVLSDLIASVAAGDGSAEYLASLVEKMEASKAAAKAAAKESNRAHKAEFLARSAAMMNRLVEKHGVAKVLEYSGQTIGALDLQCKGKITPGSLVFARLGVLDPDEVWELTCPGQPRRMVPAPTMLPELREAQKALNALICKAERLAA